MKVWNYHTLHDLNPWPDYFVYVGRAQPKIGFQEHPFCNPFPPSDHSPAALHACLERYHQHLWDLIRTQHSLFEALKSLKDKHLVCFCVPAPCHADIIKAFCLHLHETHLTFEHCSQMTHNHMPPLDSIAKKSQWAGWSLIESSRSLDTKSKPRI